MIPPNFKASQVLRADDLNSLVRYCGQRIYALPPLMIEQTADGRIVLSVRRTEAIWARLTSTAANPYGWQQIVPATAGTWVDGVMSSDPIKDPAYEYNNNTAVPVGTRVRMERGAQNNHWLFQLGPCQSSISAQPVPPVDYIGTAYLPVKPPPNLAHFAAILQITQSGIQLSHPFVP
jgi:hypothetical protein